MATRRKAATKAARGGARRGGTRQPSARRTPRKPRAERREGRDASDARDARDERSEDARRRAPAKRAGTRDRDAAHQPKLPARFRPRHAEGGAAHRPPPPRQSLAHRGGAIEQKGEAQGSQLLANALAESVNAPGDELTHGFHTHPARMHPMIPQLLVPELSAPSSIVLDPFCGSGTVLVEALVHGRRAAGVDLDPIALRIAEQQCAVRDRAFREQFSSVIRAIAHASETRVRERVAPKVPISKHEQSFYDPHVMLELSGLFEEIGIVEDRELRRALELVFSSLLVKFSRQRSDTNEDLVAKRIRKGLVTEFFERKGFELTQRWEALAEAVPRGTEPVRLWLGDARRLPVVLGPSFSASLVISSPPYGGTYDYARHHARRHAWLGLDARELEHDEIGARRNLSVNRGAIDRWDDEIDAMLASIAAVLADDGQIVFFVGDAEVAGVRVEADQQLARLVARHRLRMIASAAQPRPDFRSGRPRREHLVLIGRA